MPLRFERRRASFPQLSLFPKHDENLAGSRGVSFALLVLDEKKVDVRIVAAFLRAARADDEEHALRARAIDEVMSVAGFHRKAGAIARAHHAFSFILDEHELARDHDEEFILLLMPVPKRGPRAGLDTNEIGAELREACRVAEPF